MEFLCSWRGAPTHRVSRRLTRSPLRWRLPTGGSPRRGRARRGGKGTERGFLGGVFGRRQTASTGSHPSEVPRGEREGHLPIDHIARDTFVISSESVRSGSGRSIVILLGQGKRFSDSIRLGRVEPRVENPVVAAWNGSQVHFSWLFLAINSSAAPASLLQRVSYTPLYEDQPLFFFFVAPPTRVFFSSRPPPKMRTSTTRSGSVPWLSLLSQKSEKRSFRPSRAPVWIARGATRPP